MKRRAPEPISGLGLSALKGGELVKPCRGASGATQSQGGPPSVSTLEPNTILELEGGGGRASQIIHLVAGVEDGMLFSGLLSLHPPP